MKSKAAKPTNISDQLKAAITASGLTHYALGRAADVAPEQLDRFMSGARDLRLATAARVAFSLGCELTEPDGELCPLEKIKAGKLKKITAAKSR